jgi:ketosteroid isomerase-like protein
MKSHPTLFAIVTTLLLAPFVHAADALTKEQEALIQRERDIGQAWLKKDAKAVAAWDADEYTFTDFDGAVYDKTADLAAVKVTNFTAFASDDMKARVYGDVGVVTGRITQKGTDGDGRDIGGVLRFTDTYVKRDGRWQCVASQVTKVEKP